MTKNANRKPTGTCSELRISRPPPLNRNIGRISSDKEGTESFIRSRFLEDWKVTASSINSPCHFQKQQQKKNVGGIRDSNFGRIWALLTNDAPVRLFEKKKSSRMSSIDESSLPFYKEGTSKRRHYYYFEKHAKRNCRLVYGEISGIGNMRPF